MYKRILVPIDGSPASNLGLNEAIKLAKDQNAKLRLIHLVDEYIAMSVVDVMA
jgi:nucleotide-binding universal stress UspA family protein